jgi:uncharacterized protein YndB with AHSA1/START domain
MPTTRRTRTLAADAGDVWRVVGDVHHFPRWWPRVQRVEGVARGGFTLVMQTDKGRIVRADYTTVDRGKRAWRWSQEVEGTPFERVLASAVTGVEVAADGAGSRVTLTVEQKLRGVSRTGGFLVRRATRKILDEALDDLERLVTA